MAYGTILSSVQDRQRCWWRNSGSLYSEIPVIVHCNIKIRVVKYWQRINGVQQKSNQREILWWKSFIVSFIKHLCPHVPSPSNPQKKVCFYFTLTWDFGKHVAYYLDLTFDPRSRFMHITHRLDMGNNQAKLHPNPTICSKIMGQKGFEKQNVNGDLDICINFTFFMRHTFFIWRTTMQSFIAIQPLTMKLSPGKDLVCTRDFLTPPKKVNCGLDLWPKVTIFACDTTSWCDEQPCKVSSQSQYWQQSYGLECKCMCL